MVSSRACRVVFLRDYFANRAVRAAPRAAQGAAGPAIGERGSAKMLQCRGAELLAAANRLRGQRAALFHAAGRAGIIKAGRLLVDGIFDRRHSFLANVDQT